MNKQAETKRLPELVKMSDTYKLIVPKNVEEKIRYLLRKYPSTEWSGVLFTTYTGSFENKDLVITCQDIYPMDLGSSVYTDFNMSEEVANYMAENIELFQADCQLVHSHHQMSTFFSGTDIRTLQEEGNDRNCFVSLIVNNAGTYNAAVTRKVQTKTEIITKSLGTSYEFFGEGAISTDESVSEVKEVIDKEVIQYFMLDVEVEKVDNPLSYLDDRFDEILKKKDAAKKSSSPAQFPLSTSESINKGLNFSKAGSDYDEDFYNWIHKNRKEEPKELNLFSDKEMDEMKVPVDTEEIGWSPDEEEVRKAACRMITCSLILNTDKFDLKQWIVRHMDKMYQKIFFDNTISGINSLDQWIDFIVEYTLDTFAIPEDVELDMDEANATVAMALYNELIQYQDSSEFINDYLEVLERYIYS